MLSFGLPLAECRAAIKWLPDDFRVDEILGFDGDEEGPHWLFQVEKCKRNTQDVAKHLARVLGVCRSDIGYCGLKDRWALTRQWFSSPAHQARSPEGLCGPGWRVIRSIRHRRKLRRGAHRANRFQIKLRGFVGSERSLCDRIDTLKVVGFPNYFGSQRLGGNGANLQQARQRFDGRAGRPTSFAERMFLSAARSHLFNQVLSQRLARDCWSMPLERDIVMLDGSHSVFVAEASASAELDRRLAAMDVHLTGPLWGRDRSLSASAWRREAKWLANEDGLCAGIEASGARADRRSVRATCRDLRAQFLSSHCVRLDFTLERGVYATSLMRELVVIENVGGR